MIDVLLFPEDDGLEKFVGRLAARMAREHGVPMRLRVRGGRGFGGVLKELEGFHRVWKRGGERLPDALIVAVDANCRGIEERLKAIDATAPELSGRIVHAIADPHIERWMLLDGSAFKAVVGKGCNAPDLKCAKDRYKKLLAEAVVECGVRPLLGGIEYAEELADAMNLMRAARQDSGIRRFLSEWQTLLKRQARS